jgi:hypothetical protein
VPVDLLLGAPDLIQEEPAVVVGVQVVLQVAFLLPGGLHERGEELAYFAGAFRLRAQESVEGDGCLGCCHAAHARI